MTKPIRSSSQRVQRILATGKRVARVEPSAVATALGGEPSGESVADQASPITLYAIRAELLKRLHSSGGRPGLTGVTSRVKIPLSTDDWERLEEVAATVSTDGFSPSAGQVASVLIAAALRSIPPQSGSMSPDGPMR
jgi:hypothetical protein